MLNVEATCHIICQHTSLFPTDAQRVMEVEHLTLEGSNLRVTGANAREDIQGSVQHRTPSATGRDRPPPRIVKIAGIKPGTSESVIRMYIENKSNSEFESLDFDDDSGEAVVAFANAQGMSL